MAAIVKRQLQAGDAVIAAARNLLPIVAGRRGRTPCPALVEVARPLHLLMVMCGVGAGLIVGVIPGIGGIFGMALLIPLTYSLDPDAAFALLLGMGLVTTTSDTIPAILFGVPGTVGAAATVLDGHAMAKRGEAARALGAAYSASLIGGVFGALVLAAAISTTPVVVSF